MRKEKEINSIFRRSGAAFLASLCVIVMAKESEKEAVSRIPI